MFSPRMTWLGLAGVLSVSRNLIPALADKNRLIAPVIE